MLTVYNLQVNTVYVVATVDVLLFSCLVVMCASYLSIRSRLYSTTRSELQASHRRSTQNHIWRLSKTFYIVVAVSHFLWLPGFVVYPINVFRWLCFSPTLHWFVNALYLANSMRNPFVYSFRMKIFKLRCIEKVLQKIMVKE